MKKFFLFFSILGIAATTHAQTPLKKSVSLIHKITATWCGPCGSWGWTMANDLITQTKPKALYVSLFSSTRTDGGNDKFISATAAALANQFTLIGYPDFGANGITLTEPNYDPVAGTINTAGVKSDILAAVNTFGGTVPTASPASTMTISGNTITVNSKVKFWKDASGEFYLAAYIIEEGALNVQNQQSGIVAHHGVLRTSMSTSPWGEQIAIGNISNNQTYDKTFTFNVTEAEWDKTKFDIFTVIWKKNGSIYEFVNVQSFKNPDVGTTSINNLVNTSSLSVFPNPVNDVLNINLEGVASGMVTYNVTNILGQQMMPNVDASLKIGKNHQTLNTAKLASGMYILNIQTNEGNIQTKFVKK